MKFKNLFLVVAVAIVFAVTFTACSQSSNKASVEDTEMAVEDGDGVQKCGGEEGGEAKCGEGKEVSDSTKKCGEGKCGEGEEEDEEEGEEGKCGA